MKAPRKLGNEALIILLASSPLFLLRTLIDV